MEMEVNTNKTDVMTVNYKQINQQHKKIKGQNLGKSNDVLISGKYIVRK